jgi:hypothetical protein
MLTGGRLLQAMDSSMPRATGPHAVACADLAASARLAAEAEAQLCCPW